MLWAFALALIRPKSQLFYKPLISSLASVVNLAKFSKRFRDDYLVFSVSLIKNLKVSLFSVTG